MIVLFLILQIGDPEHSLSNSFNKMIQIVNSQNSKKIIRRRLRKLFVKADDSEWKTSRNEARIIYTMRNILQKNEMLNDHPTSTCSLTLPKYTQDLDCERPVSSTACGKDQEQYGPEFMFAHTFPKLSSPLKGQPIGIAKVAAGGSQIYKSWMKDNKDEDDNYWYSLVDAIKATKGTLQGFVWFQGEFDSFKRWNRRNYLPNLTKFIADVREEIFNTSTKFENATDVPVVIVELGRWFWSRNHTDIIEAQRTFVKNDPNALLVQTGAGDNAKRQLSAHWHYDIACQIIIGRRIAGAMQKLLKR